MVVMTVPALNTLFLRYLVDSHPLCLTAHLYWIFPGTWDLLQAEGHSLVMGLEAWQLCGRETSPERVLGVPLKGIVDVLCVGVRVLTHMHIQAVLVPPVINGSK